MAYMSLIDCYSILAVHVVSLSYTVSLSKIVFYIVTNSLKTQNQKQNVTKSASIRSEMTSGKVSAYHGAIVSVSSEWDMTGSLVSVLSVSS